MSENKERKIAYGIALACLFIGIICYSLLPAKTQEQPVRVMYECTGDNVLFDHMAHSRQYGLECADCHHESAMQENEGKQEAASCGTCHTGESAYKPALGEQGLFDHDTHSQYYGLSCTDCHHMYDPESGSSPQNCSACHAETGSDYMPSLTDSYHQQCIGCHENFGAGPASRDCTACHKPRKRTEAFHGQCAGCHEKMGAGPAEQDCQSCHGY